MINIRQIINEKSIKIHFQIILSPLENNSIYLESFVRGINPLTKEIIMPRELFGAAEKEGLANELDKLCIEQSFINFKPISDINNRAMLCINVGMSFIRDNYQSSYISNTAKEIGISCRKIFIDINNLQINPDDDLMIKTFIDTLRSKGFYISIDDIGKNYYNLDRILYFSPDIIKLNHQMLHNLKNDDYKTFMIKYITELAHKMGILVISTGVESKEDMVEALQSGAQMIQGYYVSDTHDFTYDEIIHTINTFDRSIVQDILNAEYQGSERIAITNVVNFINRLRKNMSDFTVEKTEAYANKVMSSFPFVESGYLLDHNGIQLSKPFINKSNFANRNKELFGLYKEGTDHSSEEYYTKLSNNILTDWVTRPFRSKISNEVAVTASFKVLNANNNGPIVVLTIDYNQFETFLKAENSLFTA